MALRNFLQSFRGKLTLLVAASILLPLITSSLLLFFSHYRQVNSMLEQKLAADLETLTLIVDNKTQELSLGLTRLASDNTIQMTLNLEIFPQLKNYLQDQLSILRISGLAIHDPKGSKIISVGDSTACEPTNGTKLFSNHSDSYFCHSVPVMQDDILLGHLIGVRKITQADFQSSISSKLSDHFMLGIDGKLIATDLLDYEVSKLADIVIDQNLNTISLESRSYSVVVRSISFNKKRLDCAVLIQREELESRITEMFRLIMIPIGALVILLFFILRRFLRDMVLPITQLTTAASAIELKQKVEFRLDTDRSDELGTLSRAFHDMSESISSHIAEIHRKNEELRVLSTSLESRVAERTEDLLQSKMKLEHEIAERKQAESALRQSEEHYRMIFEHSPLGVLHFDRDGFIQECNDQFLDLIGSDRQALIGRNVFSSVSDPAMLKTIHDSLEGKLGLFDGEYMSTTSGKTVPARVMAKAVTSDDGEILGSVILVENTTEQRKAEEEKRRLEKQLMQSQKMEAIGKLAGGIAHDFNNLLTGISGNVSLALMDMDQDDPLGDTLSEIGRAAERAADLTHQLLAFSRKQLIKPKVIDLNELIDGMRKMLGRIIGEDIDLQTIPGNDLWCIKADPGQIEQIIVNLAVNARDSMLSGGQLTIETANAFLDEKHCMTHSYVEIGEYVRFSIKDSGAGIPKDIQQKIFEPFFTTKDVNKGTGLGLSTVYGIVKQHKGYIDLDSEEDEGAIFNVFFPRVLEKSDSIRKRKVIGSLPTGSETVLVVEDEEIVKDIAVRTLERIGYKVLSAEGGNEALTLVENKTVLIDILVTDVIMPQMNGLELSEKMQKIYPDIAVLFTSGYSKDIIGNHGILNEELEFMSKPYTPKNLALKVRKILDQKIK